MSGKSPQIVVGLGNPGLRYLKTRHNIGFLVVDELAQRRNLEFTVCEAEYRATSSDFRNETLVLVKPLTYMNLSGEALARWSQRSGEELTGQGLIHPEPADPDCEPEPPYLPAGIRPLVICDDLILPLGAVRLRGKGSSGGQNGVQSIIEELDGEEFPRLRLGIAPQDEPVAPEFWADFVLSDFEEDELDDVREVVKYAADAVEFWLENGLDQTTSRFNRRRSP